jgi:SAM-dependent methyltransferase
MDFIDYEYFGEKGDEFFWFIGKNELLIKMAEEQGPFDKVLNLGCGVEGNSNNFSVLGNVISADIDLFSVSCAKKYADVVRTDACNISFKSNTFDCVLISDVLEHIEEDSRVVREIIHATKPGGLIVITVPAIKFLFSTHDLALGHHRRYSRKELLDLFKDLQIERIEYWNFSNLLIVAPFRLIKKFLNLQSQPDPTKVPELINKILLFLMRLENKIITKGHSLPIGLTLVVLCKRR